MLNCWEEQGSSVSLGMDLSTFAAMSTLVSGTSAVCFELELF